MANGYNLELENQLRQKFLAAVDICINQYGYRPLRFLQMLHEHNAIETAKRLVMEPRYHDGFTKLWELRRLDLSVEAIILGAPYNQLFPQEVIDTAKAKLDGLNYDRA